MSTELPMPSRMPRSMIFVFVTKISSPTSCTLLPSRSVNNCQPGQSFSAMPSSMLMIGYLSTQPASRSTNPAASSVLPSQESVYSPSAKNSALAQSSASNTSLPGAYQASSIASMMSLMAAS